SLQVLVTFLQQRPGTRVVLDEAVAGLLDADFEVCPRTQLGERCDLAIVVGGDGSMLKVASTLAEQGVPVVGINRGRLGFLTDIVHEEIEKSLGAILDGRFKLERRFLLDVALVRDGASSPLGSAMNDV